MNATRAIDMTIPSVCLSVCRFWTRWYCVKTDILLPLDSHIFAGFL